MAIQMRRGNDEDFRPEMLMPGEIAVSQDLKKVYCCFTKGVVIQLAVTDRLDEILEELEEALKTLDKTVKQAQTYATLSQSYAVGDTDSRTGEDTDNALYYKEQTKVMHGEIMDVVKDITPAFTLDYNTGHLSYALGTA